MYALARRFGRPLMNAMARRRVLRACEARIAPSAKVNYRAIRLPPPGILEIGEESIVSAAGIYAERTSCRISIGKRTYVGSSDLCCAQEITIGDDVLISYGCLLLDADGHSTSRELRRNDVLDVLNEREKDWSHVRVAPIIIESGSWICARAIILRGVTIGEGAIVGAGAVVNRSVPPYAVCAGNPARVVRRLPRDEQRALVHEEKTRLGLIA